jgi:hypothetical protein
LLSFMANEMNVPRQRVSSWIWGGLVCASVYVVITGFVMRKKFFRWSAEAVSLDFPKAVRFWRAANIFGFIFALNLAIFGFVLKFLGSSWLAPGILFGLSLGYCGGLAN